jgi:hypothetical protein
MRHNTAFSCDMSITFIAFVVSCAAVAAIYFAGGIIYGCRSDALSAKLKHEMLNRGMTAEEIKTVIEACLR